MPGAPCDDIMGISTIYTSKENMWKKTYHTGNLRWVGLEGVGHM